MKKKNQKIAIFSFLGILFAYSHTVSAMTFSDVLQQLDIYRSNISKNLGASVVDSQIGSTVKESTPAPLSEGEGKVLMKAMKYSEKDTMILKRNFSRRNNTKDDVSKLQVFLIANGYLDATPNGVYGPKTTDAVKRFQAAHGIKSDGTVVGPSTRSAIQAKIQASLQE